MKKLFMMVMTILLVSCFILGDYDKDAGAQVKGKPQYGGVLIMVHDMSPKAIGVPGLITGPDLRYTRPCVENLIGTDANGKPTPHLAESWKSSPDGKQITLYLRKGIKFHDGTDFNAEAAKFNLMKTKEGRGGELKIVESIDVIDQHTVRLNLEQYDNTLLTALAYGSGLVVSPTAVKKMGIDEAIWHPVGTGPFKFVSFKRDVILKYERFDDYWKEGLPYLDGINIVIIKDPMTASAIFQAGEAHVLTRVKEKDARDLGAKGFKLVPMGGTASMLMGDSANPGSPWSNKKVRQALEYALDKKAIVKALGYGFWEVPNQVCPKSITLGYNPDIEGRPYDPEKAKQLLTQAGYPDGFKTKIYAWSVISKDSLLTVQAYMKGVGINAEIELLDVGRWIQMFMKTGWKNGVVVGIVSSSPNYAVDLNRFFPSSSRFYSSCLKTPESDAMLAEAVGAMDDLTHSALTRKYVRYLYDEALVTPIYIFPNIDVMHKNVHDVNKHRIHLLLWTPELAWLE